MHDGRFKTLEEVLDHYSDHVQMASPGLDNNLIEGINDPPFGKHMDLTATEKRQQDLSGAGGATHRFFRLFPRHLLDSGRQWLGQEYAAQSDCRHHSF
uniref:Uncharacterized protein n=1 Tax=Tanacetum cinerariifolium TaxID=118510 RepID=A0A699V7G7_TANCI|nr:hypothetical protein [Tanacetum cinerariifolium]